MAVVVKGLTHLAVNQACASSILVNRPTSYEQALIHNISAFFVFLAHFIPFLGSFSLYYKVILCINGVLVLHKKKK